MALVWAKETAGPDQYRISCPQTFQALTMNKLFHAKLASNTTKVRYKLKSASATICVQLAWWHWFLTLPNSTNGVNTPVGLNWCQIGAYVYVTECIVCVQGHDPLTFSFLLSFLFFDWVGVLWPWLSKVLKLVCWACHVLFPPVSLQ